MGIEDTKNDEEMGNKFNSKKSTVVTAQMSKRKDTKKVAKRPKLKCVTSEKQVGYQLSQRTQMNLEVQNERAAKGDVHDRQNRHDQKHFHL